MGQATGPLVGRSRVPLPVAARDFFSKVHTFSGAQTRPYSQLVLGSFPGDKATGA